MAIIQIMNVYECNGKNQMFFQTRMKSVDIFFQVSSSILVPCFQLLDILNYNAIHDPIQTEVRSLAPNLDQIWINTLTEALLWLCRGILC